MENYSISVKYLFAQNNRANFAVLLTTNLRNHEENYLGIIDSNDVIRRL